VSISILLCSHIHIVTPIQILVGSLIIFYISFCIIKFPSLLFLLRLTCYWMMHQDWCLNHLPWIIHTSSHSRKWDLWWTKWHRGRFPPSTSVSPAKTIHSTNFSIIIMITQGSQQTPCNELITRPRSPADCPRSSNWNKTESFMEAVKAQNWAVEPQG
jgi:hypothetical protein